MTILKHTLILSILLCFAFLSAEATPSFVPPPEWRAQDPSQFRHTIVSFISKKTRGFNPSINLAKERTPLNLDGYIARAIKLHTMDKRATCENMGKLKSLSGEGVLLKIERELPWGKAELLQYLQINDGVAYMLTAAAKKEHFQNIRSEIIKSFRSFELIEDFLTSSGRKSYPLKNKIILEKKKMRLPTNISLPIIIPRLKNLEKFCAKELPEKGPYWHALLIKNVAKEIYNEKKKDR